jgi:hypothetical protein
LLPPNREPVSQLIDGPKIQAGANFANGDIHKVFPVRRPKDHAQLPSAVQNFVGAQMAFANEPVELVNGKYCGGRIVDRC